MGALSRRKGRAWEQEVARRLRDIGLECRRGWQSRAGSDDPDVIVPRLRSWLECKTGRCPNLWGAMDQAAAAAPEGLAPVVIAHRDRGRDVVVMDLHDWLEWVRELVGEAGEVEGCCEAAGDGEGLQGGVR